jgi:hypothetical protein
MITSIAPCEETIKDLRNLSDAKEKANVQKKEETDNGGADNLSQ